MCAADASSESVGKKKLPGTYKAFVKRFPALAEAHATRALGALSNSFIPSANPIGPQHNAAN